MGMMTKLRDNAHIFIIAFAVIFIAFWVFADLDIGSMMQGSPNNIGKVGSRDITYQEFQAVVDRVAEQRREENNNQDLTEMDYIQIREQVWNDFVTQAVIEQAIDDFGLDVTDQEITDWVWSANPPEELAQHFRDSTGAFNRDTYEQFLRNPGPENYEALLAFEQQMRSQLLRTKLTNILTSSVVVSEQSIRSAFVDQNIDFNVSYLFFDPRTFASTDTTAPTQEEYKRFYDRNKHRYRTDEMRKLKYVNFPEIPSRTDTLVIQQELENIVELVESGEDFLDFIATSSEAPYDSTAWSSREQVRPEVASQVFDQPVGTIVGPIPNETGLSLFKIMAERQSAEPIYKASHVLFRTDGEQDDAEQRRKAEQILARARAGEDFATLAAENSEEPGANESKGELPWFGKGRMVKEFEDAVARARSGDIIGPVKTQFGYHVIRVHGRSTRELQLAELRMSIRASSRTREDISERARDFAYFAGENGLEAEAEAAGYEVLETPDFSKQAGSFVPGIGSNPSLVKFAFENRIGTIGEVFRGNDGYVVVQVSDIRKEGYRPLEELKEQLKPQVVFDRQLRKTLEHARTLCATNAPLEQIAENNPELIVNALPPFKIQNGVPNVGSDQNFIGTLLSLKQGDRSEPFIGQRGVYVLRLDSQSPFDETAYKVKKEEIRKQLLEQLQNEFVQSWLEQRKNAIRIVDNRDRFFR